MYRDRLLGDYRSIRPFFNVLKLTQNQKVPDREYQFFQNLYWNMLHVFFL